jgi:hypothetical protein
MGLKLNGDWLSGSFRCLNAVSGSYGYPLGGTLAPRFRMLGNTISFGPDASWPRGYNSEHAVIMPQRTGGFIACILRGDGNLDGAATAIGSMTATISGEGTVVANGNMAVNRTASMSGSGTLTINPSAKGWMAAALDAGARPSAYDIAQEIWQSNAASYNTPGTMGAKVNASGSSGNPWATVIEAGMTAEEILRVIAAALAGKTEGMETGSVTFTGLDGSTIRITGTLDASGNRSGIVVDGS